jgi:VWFA-related protein
MRAQSPGPPVYTLHTNARVVLTDVTVTDSRGNPVRGLDRTAFHILDNNRPQELVSFEEHNGAQTPLPAASPSAPHTFSNDFLLHPPPVFNVLVLDTSTINIIDQMYLNEELTHFIQELPAGGWLAIYVHAGEFTLLLQNFTSDHALMLAALHEAIPKLQRPGAWRFNELDGLQQIAVYLAQLPGRKNVLWFGGGSNLFLRADANTLPIGENLRALYDQLEASRIAIYPIDVRGPSLVSDLRINFTHMQMEDEAKATGGRAFYNNNGIAEISTKIFATDANFYTLSYSPEDFRLDNKWHRVKVRVDGTPYTLSYRTGYYGDGINSTPTPKTSRTILRADGEKVHVPENRSEPIIFRADVQPSSVIATSETVPSNSATRAQKKNETTYTIRYHVPAAAFSLQDIAGGQRVEIGAGALAFNHYGRTVGRISQKFTLNFNGNKLRDAPTADLTFDQQFNLPNGQNYLAVSVWDAITGRLGTIQVPVNVEGRVGAKH